MWGGHLATLVNGQDSFCVDRWEWDGSLRVQVDDTGPSGRSRPALGADATGGMLLFGGLFEPGGDPKAIRWYNDTWRWDGSGLVQLADMGPAPRLYAQMALDAGVGHVVLYGGMTVDMAKFTETWIWDGASWTQVAASGPSPRTDAFLVWDPARKQITWCARDEGMWHGIRARCSGGGSRTSCRPRASMLAPSRPGLSPSAGPWIRRSRRSTTSLTPGPGTEPCGGEYRTSVHLRAFVRQRAGTPTAIGWCSTVAQERTPPARGWYSETPGRSPLSRLTA
jgi:hypothetical protein